MVAHRAILQARSGLFDKLLREQPTSLNADAPLTVSVPDASPDELRGAVQMCYTGTTDQPQSVMVSAKFEIGVVSAEMNQMSQMTIWLTATCPACLMKKRAVEAQAQQKLLPFVATKTMP